MKKILSIFSNALMIIIIFFSYSLSFTMNWVFNTFGDVSLDKILFQISVPMTNANSDYFNDFIKNVLPSIILCTVISVLIICIGFKKRKIKPDDGDSNQLVIYIAHKINWRIIGKFVTTILIVIICVSYTMRRTDFIKYLEYLKTESTFIKDEYVNPENVSVYFPEKKRNLVYIYLESMETTLYSKEFGGAYDESIIKELEELAKDNIVFSATESSNGIYSLYGTTWTAGALAAQTLALPLKIPIEKSSYGDYQSYLPGAIGIGDILHKQGYNQMFAIGSDAQFGGRDHLFEQHGNYQIFDLKKAISEGKRKEEDFVWWGFPDRNLFEYAKEKMVYLASKEEPFNLTLLTVDTHFQDGYICEDCELNYDEQYFNTYACSSKKVCDFVRWIQEQEFYENTTIVICGDHPSMQTGTFDKLEEEGYERLVLNIIINPAIIPENTINKYGSTMDMFPTTLASLGVKIEGNRLGLGTNLFSNEPTIVEKYGKSYVEEELKKSSNFYNQKLLYGY